MSILGIPGTRISDAFSRQALLAQVEGDEADMLRLENQVSTGQKFQLPSEAPTAAMRVMGLQQAHRPKDAGPEQHHHEPGVPRRDRLGDGRISGLITDVRAAALGVIGTTATDAQRQSVATQVQQTLQQIIATGNENYRGRYLFAGSDTAVQPFTVDSGGFVRYNGNENLLSSYGDVGQLVATNLTGSAVFGAISDPVQGSVNLHPNVTLNTQLSDLFGGQGVPQGSIAVSDGSTTKTIDLSQAKTVGNMVAMIRPIRPTETRSTSKSRRPASPSSWPAETSPSPTWAAAPWPSSWESPRPAPAPIPCPAPTWTPS